MTAASDPKAGAAARYHAAMHGCQSAILFLMNRGEQLATPKHLRVGLSSTLVDTGSMADLLIRKGLITELEYLEAIAAGAERELERLTNEARVLAGTNKLRFG